MRRVLWLLAAAVVGLLGWWGFRLLLDARGQAATAPSVPAEPDSPIGRLHAAASGAQSAPEEGSTTEAAKKAVRKQAKKPAKKDAPGEAVRKTTAPKTSAAKKSAAKKSATKKSATKKSEPKKKPASDDKPKSL